jgi:hypothetical protein
VPQGSQAFTPRQLLDAGRRAEAEGRLDAAQQFYWHLADQYAHTAEAAEGRAHLARMSATAQQPQLWQGNGASAPATESRWAEAAPRRQRLPARRTSYRLGRAMAGLVGAIGWVVIAGAVGWLAAGVALEVAPLPALRPFRLGLGTALQLAGAFLAGLAIVLLGQVARALFDQASASRELLALTRARTGGEH